MGLDPIKGAVFWLCATLLLLFYGLSLFMNGIMTYPEWQSIPKGHRNCYASGFKDYEMSIITCEDHSERSLIISINETKYGMLELVTVDTHNLSRIIDEGADLYQAKDEFITGPVFQDGYLSRLHISNDMRMHTANFEGLLMLFVPFSVISQSLLAMYASRYETENNKRSMKVMLNTAEYSVFIGALIFMGLIIHFVFSVASIHELQPDRRHLSCVVHNIGPLSYIICEKKLNDGTVGHINTIFKNDCDSSDDYEMCDKISDCGSVCGMYIRRQAIENSNPYEFNTRITGEIMELNGLVTKDYHNERMNLLMFLMLLIIPSFIGAVVYWMIIINASKCGGVADVEEK